MPSNAPFFMLHVAVVHWENRLLAIQENFQVRTFAALLEGRALLFQPAFEFFTVHVLTINNIVYSFKKKQNFFIYVLVVSEDEIRFEIMNDLRHAGARNTIQTLRGKFGEKAGVICNGPAGEHLMRGAAR